jgi:hypothetical protein
LAQHFGYRPLVFDELAINLFFVHVEAVGLVPPSPAHDPDTLDKDFNLEAANAALPSEVTGLGWTLHDPCQHNMWAYIPQDVDFGATDWMGQLHGEVMALSDGTVASGKFPGRASVFHRNFTRAEVRTGVAAIGKKVSLTAS